MSWFFIALFGYFLLAVVLVLDKLILTKSVGKPIVYTFYSTIFMFGAFLLYPLTEGTLVGIDWYIASVSGITYGLGFWTLFIAVKEGEATHINPFNGAMVTVFTFLLAAHFLGEALTQFQMIGVLVLISASIMLSFEKSKKHGGVHVGFLWALISGLFFAISHVSSKYLYELYPFWTAFMWTRATTGLLGFALLLSPTVLRTFKRKKKKAKTYAKRHAFAIVVADKVLAIIAIVLLQFAAAIGQVTLVIAIGGVMYVMMFMMVYLLSKLAPKILKEYFTRRELAVQSLAILLVAVGSYLFVL